MPALIVAALLIVAVLYWILRMYRIPDNADVRTRGIDGLQDRTGPAPDDGTLWRLDQVTDPRFAAAILMLQILRTGSPVTRAEGARILGFLADPLGLKDPAATLERAMDYAAPRRPFHVTAEALLPLLRRRLTADEREGLIDMLYAVADAHRPASDLQRAALARFGGRLCADPPRRAARR